MIFLKWTNPHKSKVRVIFKKINAATISTSMIKTNILKIKKNSSLAVEKKNIHKNVFFYFCIDVNIINLRLVRYCTEGRIYRMIY